MSEQCTWDHGEASFSGNADMTGDVTIITDRYDQVTIPFADLRAFAARLQPERGECSGCRRVIPLHADGTIMPHRKPSGDRCEGELLGPRKDDWIPVEERLPEGWVGVLVYLESGHVTEAYVTEMNSPPHIWLDRHANERLKVTHWMPLPHPPEENQS